LSGIKLQLTFVKTGIKELVVLVKERSKSCKALHCFSKVLVVVSFNPWNPLSDSLVRVFLRFGFDKNFNNPSPESFGCFPINSSDSSRFGQYLFLVWFDEPKY
jgi:hypothetical protein